MPFSEGGHRPSQGMETLMPAEPIDLFAEREALFEALQKIYTSDELRLAFTHIFEQSFSDGIFFAERYGANKGFLQSIIEDPKLILLHPKIMQALIEAYPEYSSFIADTNRTGQSNASMWFSHLQWIQTEIKKPYSPADTFLKQRYHSDDDTIHDFSAEDEPGKEMPAIHRQIDAYYDHFRLANPVPQVQLRSQTATPDPRTPTERQAETYVARQLDHQKGQTTPMRYTELETIKKKALTKGLIDEIKASLEKRGLKPEDYTIEPEANGEYKVTIIRPTLEKTEIDKNVNLKELFDLSKFEREEVDLHDNWDRIIDVDEDSITSIDGRIIFGQKFKKNKKDTDVYVIHHPKKIDFVNLPEGATETLHTEVFTSRGKVFYELYISSDNSPDSSVVIIDNYPQFGSEIIDGEVMEVGDEILIINDEPDGGSSIRFPDGKIIITPEKSRVLNIVKTGNRYYCHIEYSNLTYETIAYFENNEWKALTAGVTISPLTETPSGFLFVNNLADHSEIMKLNADGLREIGKDFSGDKITDIFPLGDSYGNVAEGKTTGKKIVNIGSNFTVWNSVEVMTRDGESLIRGHNDNQGDFIYSSYSHNWQKVPGKIIDINISEKLSNNFVLPIKIGGRECLMFTDDTFSVMYDSIDSFQSINDEIVVVEQEDDPQLKGENTIRTFTLKDRHGTPLTPEFKGKNLHLSSRDGYIVLALKEEEKFTVYRRKIDEKSAEAVTGNTLTPAENKKLELLNALTTGRQADIEAYFTKNDRTKQYEDHEAATIARSAWGAMQYQLDTDPTLLRGVVPAKDDQPTPELIERTMLLLFPSIKENRSWQRAQAEEQKRVQKARAKKEKGKPENYFGDGQKEQLVDGDPHEKDPVELFKITPAPDEFIVRFIGGRYDEHDHTWHEVTIPHADVVDSKGGRNSYKTEILLKPQRQTVLPTVLGAEVIDARIKTGDREQELEIQQTGLNPARVDAGSGASKLTYTQEKSREAPASFDISLRRYRKFLTEQSGLNTTELTTDIVGLHQELWAAIEPAVRNASMLERIDIITKYIRDIGYYDFDNGEIKGDKWGKGLDEKLTIMRARLDELKLHRGAAPLRASKKQYAGVCTDFAELGVALLRRAELAAGVMSGFQTHADASATITTKDAHSLNFVLWPTLDGGVTIIPVDVTPSGVTVEEEAYLKTMRVPDKMKNVIRQVSLYGGDKKVSASMATLETTTAAKQIARQKESKNLAEKIKSIPLTTDDVERWSAFLNIARYSGLSLPTALNTTDFNYLLEEQIKEQHRNPNASSVEPSRAMAELITDFRDRWQTDAPGSDQTVALLALRTLTEQAVAAKVLPPKYLDILDAFGKQSKPAGWGRLGELFKGKPKK